MSERPLRRSGVWVCGVGVALHTVTSFTIAIVLFYVSYFNFGPEPAPVTNWLAMVILAMATVTSLGPLAASVYRRRLAALLKACIVVQLLAAGLPLIPMADLYFDGHRGSRIWWYAIGFVAPATTIVGAFMVLRSSDFEAAI